MDSLDVVQNQKVEIVMYILYDFNSHLIKKVKKKPIRILSDRTNIMKF